MSPQTDEATDLGHQVTLGAAQMKAVEEQRDNLKYDLENTHLAKDELIKKVSREPLHLNYCILPSLY